MKHLLKGFDRQTFLKYMDVRPEEGKAFWKLRVASDFQGKSQQEKEGCASWFNKRWGGKEIATHLSGRYPSFHFFYKTVKLHQVIFFCAHGFIPDVIDHVDGNPRNNCIDNLRDVTIGENNKNKAKDRRNKSGKTGVCWNRFREYWHVYISENNKQKIILRTPCLGIAVKMRQVSEKAADYHENHGREKIT